jgi:sulfofructose kinase
MQVADGGVRAPCRRRESPILESPVAHHSPAIFEVVGLGQCSLDLLGQLGDFPEIDSKVELRDCLLQGGGPVATALVTLARLGVSTTFVGRIGDDDFGQRIRAELLAEGVDCQGLACDAGHSSQFAFIAVDSQGRRNVFWTRGSARPLAPEEVDGVLVGSCRVLHLDGLHHQSSLAAARLARQAGVMTVLDGGTFRQETAELLPWIDHLVVSERFARHLSPDDPGAALAELLLYGGKAVTVTLGERGSLTLTASGEFHRQPAFAVSAVDTTGCGDVFHGGYIYGLLQDWSLPRTVRFAAACAALKARALGGRTAIASRDEVESFLGTAPALHR